MTTHTTQREADERNQGINLDKLRAMIADDGHAISFQSMGQYRAALLKDFDDAIRSERAEDGVVEANRQLLLDRSRVGLKKYGAPLANSTLSLGQVAQHALEEALDLANYLQTIIHNGLATQQAAPEAPAAAQFKIPGETWDECAIEEGDAMRALGYEFRYLYASTRAAPEAPTAWMLDFGDEKVVTTDPKEVEAWTTQHDNPYTPVPLYRAPKAATTATCQPSTLTGQPDATICQPAATTASASTIKTWMHRLGPEYNDSKEPTAHEIAMEAEIADLRAALAATEKGPTA